MHLEKKGTLFSIFHKSKVNQTIKCIRQLPIRAPFSATCVCCSTFDMNVDAYGEINFKLKRSDAVIES